MITVRTKPLKSANLSADVVVGVEGIGNRVSAAAVELTCDSTVIGSVDVDGTVTQLSAPVYGAASADKAGLVKTDGTREATDEYALKIDDGYAYVKVPIADKFCTSAWYDPSTKHIYLSVGNGVVSCDVSGLAGRSDVSVDAKTFPDSEETVTLAAISANGTATEISAPAYLGDEATITKSAANKFSVVDNVFACSIRTEPLDINSMTLGEYLSCMTAALRYGQETETEIFSVKSPAGEGVVRLGAVLEMTGVGLDAALSASLDYTKTDQTQASSEKFVCVVRSNEYAKTEFAPLIADIDASKPVRLTLFDAERNIAAKEGLSVVA